MALEKEYASRGVRELWATKGNRHRLLIANTAGFFSQTAGSAIVSYYIFLGTISAELAIVCAKS